MRRTPPPEPTPAPGAATRYSPAAIRQGMPEYQPGMPKTVPPPALASFGARFVARVLDGLITSTFLIPAAAVYFLGPKEEGICVSTVTGQRADCPPTDATLWAYLALTALAVVLMVWYYVVPVAHRGATMGKKMMGVKVVDASTNVPPSMGQAFGRFVVAGFVSGSFCFLGYLWALFDKDRRTWHDLLCSTRVVRGTPL